MRKSWIVVAAPALVVMLLAACGKAEELQPAVGAALPVKPYAARTTPTADDLLAPTAQARPERIDEPLRRSTVRVEDPFDLPPPGTPE